MTNLGLVVPCRNEARVVRRKIANLAQCLWPSAANAHRLVIVDDGSDDGTREAAGAALAEFEDALRARGVTAELVENDVRPGKTGAITQGLRTLGATTELIVLSDADVLLAQDALVELARPFESDPRVAMACAAQVMLDDLPADGVLDPRASNRSSVYDRATAWIRRFESALGALFSVHGQLMAWRSSLAIEPTRGMAADDLDLMLQARCAGQRVVFAPRARFFEERPAGAEDRRRQAARRARAFLQFLEHPRRAEFAAAGPWPWRAQAALYLRLETLCAGALIGAFLLYVATWIGVWPPGWAWSVRIAALALSLPLALAVRRTLGQAHFGDGAPRGQRDRWETVRK